MDRPEITINLLPYATRLASRVYDAVNLAVIHCTELPDLATARAYGERIHYKDTGSGNSGHFYIERNGRIEQWVPKDRVAHHAKGYNERSIGIELINKGRYPHWFDSNHQEMSETYTSQQIDSLVWLLVWLKNDLPGMLWITGHEDLDQAMVAASDDPAKRVRRKVDPGPCFPWSSLLGRVPQNRLRFD